MEDKNSLPSSCWNLSLMSELYNVSTLDNLVLAFFGRERESHLLHLVTEQWLPPQCLFLLDNFITVLTSPVCATWNWIMDTAVKIKRDKILMLSSCFLPRLLSFLSAVKLIIGSALRCLKGWEVYLFKIQSCLYQTELSKSPGDTQQLERMKSSSSGKQWGVVLLQDGFISLSPSTASRFLFPVCRSYINPDYS